MRVIAVIPVRMGSSRFPGKPLAKIVGKPMVEHVYRRCMLSSSVDEVFVATCDQEIAEATEAFGARAIMTASTHERASDRVAEAVQAMDVDIVVMVQGDEPLVHPDMIDLAVQPMVADPDLGCVNLARAISDPMEFNDPNTIKVVMDRNGFAAYFSRAPIPAAGAASVTEIPAFKQVCIIPFRKDRLLTFTELPPTRLEQTESIDMLRFLEHGYPVKMIESPYDTYSVDTPQDLARVEALMRRDPIAKRYS